MQRRRNKRQNTYRPDTLDVGGLRPVEIFIGDQQQYHPGAYQLRAQLTLAKQVRR